MYLKIRADWLKWLQIVLFALLAPFFIFPSVKRTWIFLIVIFFLFVKWGIQKKTFERTVVDWAVFILIIQVFLSSIRTTDLDLSLPKIAGVIYGILVFYIIVDSLNSRKLIQIGCYVFLCGGVVLSVVGILGMKVSERFFQRSKLDLLLDIHKKIPKINFNLLGAEEGFNANALAGTLVLVVPVMFVFILYYMQKDKLKNIPRRIWFGVIVLFFLFEMAVVMLAASRISWVALTISIIFSIWIYFMIPKKKMLWLLPLIGGAFLVLIFGYIAMVKPENIEAAKKELGKKLEGRFQAWRVGVETIEKHPLTGIGMNHIRLERGIGYKRAHVHNHLIHTAAELGLPGLVAYLAILMGAGYMCWQVIKKSKDGFMKMAALGLGCGQLAHFLFGMGDSIPLGAKPGIFFWVSLALIAGMYREVQVNRRAGLS